jgi:hypothetical protein
MPRECVRLLGWRQNPGHDCECWVVTRPVALSRAASLFCPQTSGSILFPDCEPSVINPLYLLQSPQSGACAMGFKFHRRSFVREDNGFLGVKYWHRPAERIGALPWRNRA